MIAITGATGNLGRLVVNDLLDREVSPSEVVAAVRSPEKASDLAERGVEVREADYTESDDLRRLIGRPTTPMAKAVADALEARG